MKTKLIALFLAFAMTLSLCACGTPDTAGSTPPDTQSPTASQPADGSAASGTDAPESPASYIFTDDIGREVEVPAEITRIAPTAALSQMILFAIAPDLFAGLASRWNSGAEEIISDKYLSLPYFGSLYASPDLNVEELALAAPQIIIDIGENKDSSREDMDALQVQTGIPSVFISATLETMPQTYRTLGKLLGREERGEELAQFCERVYRRTMDLMAQVGEDRVNALYVLGEEGLNVIAANSYHAEVMDLLINNLAVVDNPVSKGFGNDVTMEQIALWDPEFVIFAPDSIYDRVEDMAAWDQITAIRNGDYVKTPGTPHNWMSMPPSVQRYLALIWLPSVLYPDYCDYDAKAEILEYYELFYGCTLTEEQYSAITKGAFLE